MATPLKTLLQQDRLIRVFGLGQLCHPKLVEILGLQEGFDAVWLDQEHAGLTIPQLEEATRAARGAGLDSFVRLHATDYASVMRALEAGANGIMAAMVRSARQAEELLTWARFHPRGCRGVNGTGVDGRYGLLPLAEYLQQANRETFVGIQIEHADAVAEVEQIAALDDVDFLFIGPADLSQSLGVPGEVQHPRFIQALKRVAEASRQHQVPWGILPVSPEHARECVALGCRILSLGLDTWAFARGVRSFQEDFDEFFDPPCPPHPPTPSPTRGEGE
jgi:4-hydroxy-2-oxoheptanedioate aldolase